MRSSHSSETTSSRRRAGFTLIEMLVVLAIIGMLLTLGLNQFGGILQNSKESVVRVFVNESIKASLLSYQIHVGTYPSTQEGLQALVSPPASRKERWRGPYYDPPGGQIPADPWGNPYQYRFPGTKNPPSKYDLFSFGPDGVESDDDIGNW